MAKHLDKQKVSENIVKKFRSLVLVACPSLVTLKEQRVIQSVPLEVFENVFKNIFNSDMGLAARVLFNLYKDLDTEVYPDVIAGNDELLGLVRTHFEKEANSVANNFDDYLVVEGEEDIANISTLPKAALFLKDALINKDPILIIADIDNDGALAHAMAIEAKKMTGCPMYFQGREYNDVDLGFSMNQINNFVSDTGLEDDSNFTVVCADLGSNQNKVQKAFLSLYPNAKLVIADHHGLQPDNRIEEELDNLTFNREQETSFLCDVFGIDESDAYKYPEAFSTFKEAKYEARIFEKINNNSDNGGFEPTTLSLWKNFELQTISDFSTDDFDLKNGLKVVKSYLYPHGLKQEFNDRVRIDKNDLKRSAFVSPFTKGSVRLAMKAGGGVSGCYLLYSIFKRALVDMKKMNILDINTAEFLNSMSPMKDMAKAANLFELVDCGIQLKPLVESEITKAFKISSLTNSGKSLGKWIRPDQKNNISNIEGIVGKSSTAALEALRLRMVEQNHIARAIYESLGTIYAKQEDGTLIEKEITEIITSNIVSLTADRSADTNYLELLRPYIFSFEYENQFPKDVKEIWLNSASTCLKAVQEIEKNILDEIRVHRLIKEIPENGKDFVIITQPEHPLVSSVFTEKQRSTAYSNVSKDVNMSVNYASKDKVVLRVRSDHPMDEILSSVDVRDAEVKFLLDSIKYSGHGEVGFIELPISRNASPNDYIERLADIVDVKVKRILSGKRLEQTIEVKPIHLDIIKEMFQKMRIHLEPRVSPMLVMKINENSSFEDTYTTEKKSVAAIIQDDPWKSTSEALDFGQKTRLTIPNQAIKAVVNDNYDGALGIKFLPNGSFIANKVITPEQLELSNPKALIIPLDKERNALKQEYIRDYMSQDLPVRNVGRQDAKEALEFMTDGAHVFETNERVVLGIMDRFKADSYIVLDVEADGAGSPFCIDTGLTILKRAEGVFDPMTKSELEYAMKKNPQSIRNYRADPEGDSYFVNEELTVQLFSQIIGKDGSKPINISIKTQNLTNLTQDFIDEVGMSSIDAQNNLVEVLSKSGKFVIGAHNLPYDNKVMEVNYPEVYELMKNAIHIDSAIPSKNLELAYVATTVTLIATKNFFNSAHKGYNLSTLLEDVDGHPSFRYPDIKGETILQVSGEDVNVIDISSGRSSLVPSTRTELAEHAKRNIQSISKPKYSIEKMLRMLTVKEIISQGNVEGIIKRDFTSFDDEELPKMPDVLWQHFQENYGFDLTLEQNINNFHVLPDASSYMNEEFHVESKDDLSDDFVEYRNYGARKTYDLGRKPSKAKLELFTTVTGRDLLKANAIMFLEVNSKSAERFSLSWVYESVLHNHEVSSNPSNMKSEFFDGMSKLTGFPEWLLMQVYKDTHAYKQSRGIKTYKTHEIHCNIGLRSDTYQELHAFIYLLNDKTKNNFAIGDYLLGVDQPINGRVLDVLAQEAASSTIKQTIRNINGMVIDDNTANSYGAKQVEQFSDDGISIKGDESGVPKFKCKGVKGIDVSIQVEVPNFDVIAYKALPKGQRKDIEDKLNSAVSSIVLANSLKDKSLTPVGESILIETLTSPDVIANLKEVNDIFGEMKVTRKEEFLKKMCKNIAEAVVGKEPLKLPGNPAVSPSELDEMVDMFSKCIDKLKSQQGFNSFITVDELKSAVSPKKAEYLCYQESIKTGVIVKEVPGYEPTNRFLAPGAALKAINSTLQEHIDACPSLALGVTSVKEKPLNLMLQTPMTRMMVKMDDADTPEFKNTVKSVWKP